MSKIYTERPPVYRGPSKIPRFDNKSAALPPVEMNSGGQRNPSKLQQLQSNYQQRLMKEKEEKLIKMYEDNQRKALQKVNSQSKMTVRDFFKERRQLEQNADNAHALPSMNTHYKIKRMDVQSDTEDPWVHRQNSNNSLKYAKTAKGRDKSNPLAPIDRNRGQNSMIPAPVPQKPQRHGRPWTLKETTPKNTTPVSNGHAPKSAPSHGLHVDENFPVGQMTPSDDTPPPNLTSFKSLQKQKRHQYNGTSSKPSSGFSKPQKKSDFQNWQMEQDKAREERLKKAGIKPTPAYEYEETDDEESADDEIAKQQRELMARIQQQQRELEGMRKQREREEEQEKKEMEKRRKREEERRRRLKEEEEQRLRDEAERRIRDEEERERQQQISFREEYSAPNRTTRRYSPKSMYEDDMISYKTQPTPPPPQTKPVRVQRKVVKAHPPPKPPPPRESSPALPAPSNQDISFFLAAANDPEAHASSQTNLVSCSNCGRKFASDRIQKHRAACGNLTKKRKVHDPSKMRVAGTDMEKYNSSSKKQRAQPMPKKSNWRTKHENFIQTIRYAKKVTEMEKTGASMSALPPPPPSDTSDYKQCPWCSRKFNPSTAERHIPRCKDIKSRPAPPRKR